MEILKNMFWKESQHLVNDGHGLINSMNFDKTRKSLSEQ